MAKPLHQRGNPEAHEWAPSPEIKEHGSCQVSAEANSEPFHRDLPQPTRLSSISREDESHWKTTYQRTLLSPWSKMTWKQNNKLGDLPRRCWWSSLKGTSHFKKTSKENPTRKWPAWKMTHVHLRNERARDRGKQRSETIKFTAGERIIVEYSLQMVYR